MSRSLSAAEGRGHQVGISPKSERARAVPSARRADRGNYRTYILNKSSGKRSGADLIFAVVECKHLRRERRRLPLFPEEQSAWQRVDAFSGTRCIPLQ